MQVHQQVKSGVQISQSIAEFLETVYPEKCKDEHTAQIVDKYNGILNGRGSLTPDELIQELESLANGDHADKVSKLCEDIRAFIEQKQMLSVPYNKSASKDFKYRFYSPGSEKSLKIVNQQIYDSAYNHGFPSDFFMESYFDGVVFYCVPDHADFNSSRFNSCRFIVCRIWDVSFDGTSFNDTQFHTVDMRNVTFNASSFAHTHFYDSALSVVSFQKAWLKSCCKLRCVMDRVGYFNTVFNGCSLGGITATGTEFLETAVITMGGATSEECEKNRASIFNELGVDLPKKCKLCGSLMVWENPHTLGSFQESSCNIEDWQICLDCMIEHCCQTNCYSCRNGLYPDCRFIEMKRYYMQKE